MLESVKSLAENRLIKQEMQKVLFFQPEDLFFFLMKEAA